ncbi:unnamed protein product [Discula destructiva]
MEQLRQRLCGLQGENYGHLPGLSAQMQMITTEKAAAEVFLASLADESITWRGNIERFRNSNIPAVEQLWTIVKRCRHVASFHHQVVVKPTAGFSQKFIGVHMPRPDLAREDKVGKKCPKKPRPDLDEKDPRGKKGARDDVVNVNAVVDGGAEWLRVFSTSEKRLLHEMADAGWDWGAEDDESDDDEGDAALFEDIEIFRTAKQLVQASRMKWHNYRHPRIRLIFTRIQEGHNSEIDRLIQKLRSFVGVNDITVKLDFADSTLLAEEPPIDLDTAITNMLPQHDTTSTVLLDTSVLVALASDISHTAMEKQLWHGADAYAQIQAEVDGRHFLLTAYPRLRGRKLVCTAGASQQFLKITNTIGSQDEVARASHLLDGRWHDFQKLSIHPVPEDLMLPVQVVDEQTSNWSAASLVRDGILPPVAIEIGRHLCGQGTHLYGWVKGLTVITGNRILAHKIVRIIEECLPEENNNCDYDKGPRICALSQNRALGTRGPSLKKARKLARQGLWPPAGHHLADSTLPLGYSDPVP